MEQLITDFLNLFFMFVLRQVYQHASNSIVQVVLCLKVISSILKKTCNYTRWSGEDTQDREGLWVCVV